MSTTALSLRRDSPPMFGRGDVRFFDRVAPLYDAVMPPASADRLRAGLAFAHRPVERAVDLGGGTGRVALRLRELGVDAAVVDASPGMLRRARDRGLPAVRADAGRLPVPDRGVDAVVVADALHHFPDPDAALRAAARVVAPGGVVVVRDFDPDTAPGRLLAAGERLLGMDSSFRTAEAVADALTDAGLRGRVVAPGFDYTVAGVKPTEDGPESG